MIAATGRLVGRSWQGRVRYASVGNKMVGALVPWENFSHQHRVRGLSESAGVRFLLVEWGYEDEMEGA